MEGVIKFNIKEWQKTDSIDKSLYGYVEEYREKLHVKRLIGFDDKLKLGYGNISTRINDNSFIITATQTGHLSKLDGNNYTIIDEVDFINNSVVCKGPAAPSSESLTHAACYYSDKKINGVIHIHSKLMWKKLYKSDYPSTPKEALYGSIALYNSIIEIIQNNKKLPKLIHLKGHEDGIISAGETLEDAYKLIIKAIQE